MPSGSYSALVLRGRRVVEAKAMHDPAVAADLGPQLSATRVPCCCLLGAQFENLDGVARQASNVAAPTLERCGPGFIVLVDAGGRTTMTSMSLSGPASRRANDPNTMTLPGASGAQPPAGRCRRPSPLASKNGTFLPYFLYLCGAGGCDARWSASAAVKLMGPHTSRRHPETRP